MALTPWRRAHLLTTTIATPIVFTDFAEIPHKPDSRRGVARPDNYQLRHREGDTVASRVVYVAIALVCMSLLGGMFGRMLDLSSPTCH